MRKGRKEGGGREKKNIIIITYLGIAGRLDSMRVGVDLIPHSH